MYVYDGCVLVHDGPQTPADICSGIAAAGQTVQIQSLTPAQLLLLGNDLHTHRRNWQYREQHIRMRQQLRWWIFILKHIVKLSK